MNRNKKMTGGRTNLRFIKRITNIEQILKFKNQNDNSSIKLYNSPLLYGY